jgi:hypothetical protein
VPTYPDKRKKDGNDQHDHHNGGFTGGVDTHGETHHGAALDSVGRQLGDREFPTTTARRSTPWVANSAIESFLRPRPATEPW